MIKLFWYNNLIIIFRLKKKRSKKQPKLLDSCKSNLMSFWMRDQKNRLKVNNNLMNKNWTMKVWFWILRIKLMRFRFLIPRKKEIYKEK